MCEDRCVYSVCALTFQQEQGWEHVGSFQSCVYMTDDTHIYCGVIWSESKCWLFTFLLWTKTWNEISIYSSLNYWMIPDTASKLIYLGLLPGSGHRCTVCGPVYGTTSALQSGLVFTWVVFEFPPTDHVGSLLHFNFQHVVMSCCKPEMMGPLTSSLITTYGIDTSTSIDMWYQKNQPSISPFNVFHYINSWCGSW